MLSKADISRSGLARLREQDFSQTNQTTHTNGLAETNVRMNRKRTAMPLRQRAVSLGAHERSRRLQADFPL